MILQVLQQSFGKKAVFLSGSCNELSSTTGALLKLAGVRIWDLFPKGHPVRKAIRNLLVAKLHGSTAMVPALF